MINKRISAIVAVFMISFVLLSGCGKSYVFSNDPRIPSIKANASHMFIYDMCNDSCTVFSADDSDVVYPASTTKLLTALLSLEILPPETLITPGDEVYFAGEHSSSAYIRPHHTLTLEMLIEGMLIPSGNDAAYAIAAACGRVIAENEKLPSEDSVRVFVDEMNNFAAEIGCTSSNFTTPDGLAGKEHYSTTNDMAKIARMAVDNEIIMRYAGLLSDDVVYASGHTNKWVNTNEQLDPSSKFYNEYVNGLKTGSLTGSYSIITTYNDGENNIIIGVFGAPTENARYVDTSALISAYIKSKK